MDKLISTYGVDIGNRIVFTSSEMNLIWFIDKKSRVAEVLGSVPNEDFGARYLFSNIVQYRDWLYFIPLWARNLWKYNLVSHEWICIELPSYLQRMSEKFFGAFVYNNKIMLLGYKFKGYILLDTENDEYEIINVEVDCKDDELGKYGFLNWSYLIRDGYVIAPILCTNMVLKINLSDYSYQGIKVGPDDCKYAAVIEDANNFWLVPRVGRKVIFVSNNNQIKLFSLPKEYLDDEMYFGNAFVTEDEIWFSSYIGKSFAFNKNDFALGHICNMNIQFAVPYEGKIMFQGNDSRIFILGKELQQYSYSVDEKKWNYCYGKLLLDRKASCTKESEHFSVKEYLDYIERL